jgi:aurora kinase
MKFGEFVKQIKEDPLYDFKNFEFVKTGMINQIIGSGAFGDVLLARNKIDHKLYAIKQMNKNTIIEMCSNLEVVKREIEIHRKLIHENIVRMYSYHEDKDAFYLVKIV